MSRLAPDLSRLSIEQLSVVTGRDRRTVTSRLRGLEPAGGDGKTKLYEAPSALKRIYLGDDWQLDRERTRLAKEQADKLARENALAAGEVVEAAEVEDFLVRLCSTLILRLRAVPSKAAPEVHACKTIAECEAVLRRHQDEALTEAAEARWLAPTRAEREARAGGANGAGGTTST